MRSSPTAPIGNPRRNCGLQDALTPGRERRVAVACGRDPGLLPVAVATASSWPRAGRSMAAGPKFQHHERQLSAVTAETCATQDKRSIVRSPVLVGGRWLGMGPLDLYDLVSKERGFQPAST